MKLELVEILRCPNSGQSLHLASEPTSEIEEGYLVSKDGAYRYPIHKGIPRFVPSSNYADNFGMQWNYFAKTQLDSHSGHSITAERFWHATGWSVGELDGRWVLDAGCGSGRFAEIALSSGANVVALDYSSAVDACWSNLKGHPKLHVVQGNIYELPFAQESFDFVYSLGVLQHTPDVAQAFAALPPMVRRGGKICVDYYEKSLVREVLEPKYWLRPFTTKMEKQKLFELIKAIVPILLPVSRTVGKVPLAGRVLKRMIPVANYDGVYPLNEKQLYEWSLLDTFDWFSPMYDKPQNRAVVKSWMEKSKLSDIEVLKARHLVARGKK